ncbi:unnamed protein product [Brassicogethes aeneus]|uniref:Uncharacterized protein n=1 Tax=Brassicogethes aeneus TaxID=1431903 RepID=A0A9P0FNX4_BRAAE|nr:unnamed protein product [Brassicogethes aeneus]
MHFYAYLTVYCVVSVCKSDLVRQKCPVQCVCNEGLTDCSDGNLSVLPDGIYSQVVSLDLSRNNFTQFPSNFTELDSLIKLNISHNNLQTIEYGAFQRLSNIKILDLSSNKFKDWKDIKSSTFDYIDQLDVLDFSNNNLGNVRFTNIISLTTLRLNNCNLRSIEGIFQPKNILRDVYLANNNIRSIPANLVAEKLEILDLTNAGIFNISETAFAGMPYLNELILKHNIRLKNIRLQSNSLISIDASGCSLEHVPEGDFSRIEIINLSGNKITMLKSKTFERLYTTQVLTANFSENSISKIYDGAFNNALFLNIDLSFNRIAEIPENLFTSQTKLVKLNLSHNFIQVVSWTIDNLLYLDISYNEIKNIDVGDFQNMPKLESLIMRRNFISIIPDNTYLPKLKYLDVSLCKIRKLTNKTFADMDSLRILDLRSNQLSSVNPSYFPKISDVQIYGNPWRCECPALKAMYEHKMRYHEDVRLICDTPEKLSGKTWKEACQNEWYPQVARRDNLWVYSVGIIITMSMMLGIIVTIKKISKAKSERLRQFEEERLNEERESLRRMEQAQRRAREEQSRNAPDPRASIGPPSYIEALSLPRLDASHPSLNSLYNIREQRSFLTGSNPEISRKNKVRRKRRRKSDAFQSRRASAASVDTDSSDDKATNRLQLTINPLESDF